MDDDDLKSVMPDGQPPCIDITDTLYREILLSMRYQLQNDGVFVSNLQLLLTIIKNIINDPFNPKFQKLRLSNPKIKEAIG